jgi:hypothetical protein
MITILKSAFPCCSEPPDVDAGDQDAEGGRVRAKGKGKKIKNQTAEGGRGRR